MEAAAALCVVMADAATADAGDDDGDGEAACW